MTKIINNWWWVKKAPIGIAILLAIGIAELVHLKKKASTDSER